MHRYKDIGGNIWTYQFLRILIRLLRVRLFANLHRNYLELFRQHSLMKPYWSSDNSVKVLLEFMIVWADFKTCLQLKDSFCFHIWISWFSPVLLLILFLVLGDKYGFLRNELAFNWFFITNSPFINVVELKIVQEVWEAPIHISS